MEKGLRRGQVLVLLGASLLLLLSRLPPTLGAPNKKAVAAARKEDIPFIRCQVCEKIAHQLHHQVKKKEAQISPKKISELQIIEIAENVCDLKKEEADWLLRIDIVETSDALELVEQESEGQCNSECKTLERACQEVMGYSDTDVAEYMYTSKPSLDSLVKFLCRDLTKSCLTKPPPVPKDRVPGEPFVPKSSKDAEMEKILRSMEGMPGAPSMKMYSREDLLNNKFGGEETDDEEDEDNFPSNLGKVLRNKDSEKGDLKQRILKGIKQTTTAVRNHVNKVSHRIQKWWKGRTNSKSPKSANGEL
ncbi:hypothetical protein Taro_036907 [Colocasia esculenta]|uniref:Saposin B-type domain-containing protein n=1 Tax=Colocasia esculenta TaxID=4460 RepID=A0A843WEP5_COLES|nr:hypothetical protein [Colocasia esculenta]